MMGNGHVLVVNSGSSSVKYRLTDADAAADAAVLARGSVERIGTGAASLTHQVARAAAVTTTVQVADHGAALHAVLDAFTAQGPTLSGLLGVGHRIVHGGPDFTGPVLVDDAVERAILALEELAPLHNADGLLGLRLLRGLLHGVPHVAVFDTAFHATIPENARRYALPVALADELGIRRYGFHGSSFRHVTRSTAAHLRLREDETDLVICHLGNGASACAVREGRSIDTSMGMTPLAGLVMGSRSGDLDPSAVLHLMRQRRMGPDDVDDLLNRHSGLLGLAGASDMREVRKASLAGDAAARLTLDIYGYRLRGYIAAYLALLPHAKALVFTGGVGEHDAVLRSEICEPLRHLGLRLDPGRNAAADEGIRAVDDGSAAVRVLVVPTDEEAEIAAQTLHVLRGTEAP